MELRRKEQQVTIVDNGTSTIVILSASEESTSVGDMLRFAQHDIPIPKREILQGRIELD